MTASNTDREASPDWQLDGVTMHVISTAANGEVGADTMFHFQQQAGIVSCRYAGGAVVDGFLLGHIEGDILHFVYVQAERDGRLDAGTSRGELREDAEGRLHMTEHFTWFTRTGSGQNEFVQVDDTET